MSTAPPDPESPQLENPQPGNPVPGDSDPVQPDPHHRAFEPDALIGAEGTEAPGEPRRNGCPQSRDLEEELDAALACTFPASDPISRLRGSRDEPWTPGASD
jgi:hypothetical protein